MEELAYKLTPREKEILQLCVLYTSAEIGDKLSLSPRTVEWHIGNIFHKMDVSKIQTAVCKAIKDGLIKNIA